MTVQEVLARYAVSQDACSGCFHWRAEHIIDLGPIRLCMTSGCRCGRRSIARMARAVAPWSPVLAAAAYLAYHLALWHSRGFLVRAW